MEKVVSEFDPLVVSIEEIAREAAKIMIQQGIGGSIMNISSKSGLEASINNTAYILKVAELNVLFAIEQIKQQSDVLKKLLGDGHIGIIGAMYDVETGKVEFITD